MSFDKAKLFSTNATYDREITACGETFSVGVRRLPAVDLREYYAELMSNDAAVKREAGFKALAKAIRNTDGTAFATVQEYRKMYPEAIVRLIEAFTEVNTQAMAEDDLGNA